MRSDDDYREAGYIRSESGTYWISPDSDSARVALLHERIRELERLVDDLTAERDALLEKECETDEERFNRHSREELAQQDTYFSWGHRDDQGHRA